MRFAIMGAGGVGGYLGAKLAAGGQDVTFIARGAHLEAMRTQGLIVQGAEQVRLAAVDARDTPDALGPVDVVLFCVKLHDTVEAGRMIAPVIGPDTMVVTFQNGIESVDVLARQLGAKAVLGGAAYFPSSITAPGEITYYGKPDTRPHTAFGEPTGGQSERTQALAAVFDAAGIVAQVCDDTNLMLWEKFLLVVANSAATALTRQPIGVVRSDPDMRWLLSSAIAEAEAVGRKIGIPFAQNIARDIMAALDTMPEDGKASQLVDLENGRKLELDGLSGAIVRLGRQHGVSTPVHASVYAALKPYRAGLLRA